MGCESSILVNGGFENWTEDSPDGWISGGIQEAVIVHGGNYSSTEADGHIIQVISLPESGCYVFSFWYNSISEAVSWSIYTSDDQFGTNLTVLQPDGTWVLNPPTTDNIIPATNGWEYFEIEFNFVSDIGFPLFVVSLGETNEINAYFDDVCLYPCEIPAGDDALSATCGESLFKIDILRQRIRTDGTNYYLVVK